MKPSEITSADLALYLRLDSADGGEEAQLGAMLAAARAYIRGYTGLTDEEIDTHRT